MASKRSSSPPDIKHLDKRAFLDAEFIQRLVDESVIRQMGSIEQLVFKDTECQKLGRKHQEVDSNCRRWHEFAVGLQNRVKRLAVILHKQQDAIKNMKLEKHVQTADISVQTDPVPLLPELSTVLEHKKKNLTVKEEFITAKKEPGNVGVKRKPLPSDIIDLTDDDSDKVSFSNLHYQSKPTSAATKIKDGFQRQGNSTPLTGTNSPDCGNEAMNSLNRNSRSTTQAVPAVPRGTMGFHSHELMNSSKVRGLALGNRGISTSTMAQKHSVTSTLYPPLPSMPLPPKDLPKGILAAPFQPLLKIRKSSEGIELSWDHHNATKHAKMDCYELYVYQHNPNNCATSNRWKIIKNEPIKAMTLPMACTLSQFSSTSKYYFAVRGRDIYGRYGAFSAPCCSTDLQQ